jgi:hypothetical protein
VTPTESENLKRWDASGQPKRWVVDHQGSWNHDDWLLLVQSLERSEFWPMDLDAVGGLLDLLKKQWLRKQHAKAMKSSTSGAAEKRSHDLDSRVSPLRQLLDTTPLPRTSRELLQPSLGSLYPATLAASYSVPCVVCGGPVPQSALSLLGMFGEGREGIIQRILRFGLSVTSLESFWNQHRSNLCTACTSQLDSLKSIKQQGLRLLEEAVRLDPSNAAAMQNLDAVRKWA